jgi:hypothetical protein
MTSDAADMSSNLQGNIYVSLENEKNKQTNSVAFSPQANYTG